MVEPPTRADIYLLDVPILDSAHKYDSQGAVYSTFFVTVMGTHGRSGLDRIFMGGVVEHVVRNAPAPVVTIRPDQKDGIEEDMTG